MKTGTIKETQQFKNFDEYVKGKFTSMSHFSLIQNGKLNGLNGIQFMADNKKAKDKIRKLERLAQQLTYERSKVYISDYDRLKIREVVKSELRFNKMKLSEYLRQIKFSRSAYDVIMSGRNIYKNKPYTQLISILGL